jgi:hypothetical protein
MGSTDTVDKQPVRTGTGFQLHPENINREGRPKRKTLTELIHAKLDDTPDAWEAVIRVVLEKLIKEKDPQILKTFWQYTDGMPNQKIDMTGKIENITITREPKK